MITRRVGRVRSCTTTVRYRVKYFDQDSASHKLLLSDTC